MPAEEKMSSNNPKEILEKVYAALQVKGYDPTSQVVGYSLSGDPTYITSCNDARSLITKVENEDLLEEIVKNYFENV